MATGSSTSSLGAPRRPLDDGVWRLDQERTEIGFAVGKLWGLRTVRGTFSGAHGRFEVRAGAAKGKLTIEAASIGTVNRTRDRHLRSPAFFDVERYPEIVFTTASVAAGEKGLSIAGELAIRASRTRIEIPLSVERTVDGGLRMEGDTTVSRSAAGVPRNLLGVIRDDTLLHVRLTLAPASE
jgi:polyisoprenoid-binding protein YceI